MQYMGEKCPTELNCRIYIASKNVKVNIGGNSPIVNLNTNKFIEIMDFFKKLSISLLKSAFTGQLVTSQALREVIFSRLAAIISVTHQLSSRDCNILSFLPKVKAFWVCHLLPARLVIANCHCQYTPEHFCVTAQRTPCVRMSSVWRVCVREQNGCSVHHFD